MGNFYLESIRESQKGYIDDPWVFLRELAQNSRDSGALEIRIDPGGRGSDNEAVIFSDNGRGMTYREAEKYLFRLYSSSKGKDRSSVGMYGVGFWTIMKFDPFEIRIESYSDEEDRWGIILDSDLNHVRTECKLTRFGTRITLVRKSQYPDFGTFCSGLEKGVRKYCSFLDQRSEKGKMLPVIFMGKLISEPLKFDEGITLRYGNRNFDAVVGLGEVPKVKLFTGGIPAWEGSTLDELSILNGKDRGKNDTAKNGVAPVFYINGRNLKVNMSRKELMDDRSLQEVIKRSRKALNELVQICSDHAWPPNRMRKFFFKMRKFLRNIGSSYWKIILSVLLIVIPIEIFLISNYFSREGPDIIHPDVVSLDGFRQYSATVEKLGEGVVADIQYSPGENLWLKLFTAAGYDIRKGFVPDISGNYLAYENTEEYEGGEFRMNILVHNGGEVFLPCPLGTRVVRESVRISRVSRVMLKTLGSGEVLASVPGYNKNIVYSCEPENTAEETLSGMELLELPAGVIFPDEIESRIKGFFYQNTENKVLFATRLTHLLVRYDTSPGTALYFKNFNKNDKWLDKVLEIGAGDCDVINTVLCIILRKSGVRSRLVIGLLGEGGYTLPGLHSWVEYYDNGWKEADASATAVIQRKDDNNEAMMFFSDDPDNPDPAPGESRGSPFLKLVFLLFLLSLLPMAFLIRERLAREKEKRGKLSPGNKIKARRDIIRIGKSYLLDPGLWDRNFDIVEQEIITTISGKNISIKKAVRLLNRRKLFLGKASNPLVEALKRSDEVIIDQDNSIQQPLIRLFSGITDLDRIHSMSPVIGGTDDRELPGIFISGVNDILRKLNWKGLRCLAAENLNGRVFLDVDLSMISWKKFFRKTGYPERFIAVNTGSEGLSGILELFPENPGLSLFRFFKLITEESLFFYYDRDISFRKILREIVKNG